MGKVTADSAVSEVAPAQLQDSSSLTLAELNLLVQADNVKKVEEKIKEGSKGLIELNKQLTFLRQLQKFINTASNSKGGFDASEDKSFKKILKDAEKMGIELPKEKGKIKYKFNADEKHRLLENIRLTCDDTNLRMEQSMMEFSRLSTLRNEAFQLAKSIFDTLNKTFMSLARSIAGR